MSQRELFKEEHGYDCYAYRQEYAGARQYQDGFNDEYVEWLEEKISKLSLCDKTQKNELLEALLKDADDKGNIVLIESIEKIIKDFNK